MRAQVKRIAFWTLLVIMVAGVVPWGLVRLGNLWFSNPPQARTAWVIAGTISFYERDVIAYNIGNTYLAERDYDAAAAAYKSADENASPKVFCPNRYNWGLTLMQKGDSSTSRDTARTAYSEALRVISIDSCQNDPAHKERFNILYVELLKRLKAVNEEPDESQEGSQEDSEDQEKAEEIVKDDEGEKASAKDYQNQRRYDAGKGGSGSGSTRSFEFVW